MSEYCTLESAEREAETIRNYWRDKNKQVRVDVVLVPIGKGRHTRTIYSVRSDIKMVEWK